MTVYDCFMFYDELDLLELRMNILNDSVDKFMIVQSNRTLQGDEKAFAVLDSRFDKFKNKIIYYNVDGSEHDGVGFGYEFWVRNSIKQKLIQLGVSDDDIIILSDVDEIPDPTKFATITSWQQPTIICMRFYYFYINCQVMNEVWKSVKIFKYGNVEDMEFNDIRGISNYPVLYDAGWHFSYIGGAEKIRNKIKTFSHSEYNCSPYTDLSYIKECMSKPADLFGRDVTLSFVKIDNTYPKYILDNIKDLDFLIKKVD